MKLSLFCLAALASVSAAFGESVEVKEFSYRGPLVVSAPVMVDTLDVKARPYDIKSALKYHVNLDAVAPAAWSGDIAPGSDEGIALNFLSFPLVNKRYAEVTVESGLKDCMILVDGKPVEGNTLRLTPASREITLKYLSKPGEQDSLNVTLTTADPSLLSLTAPAAGRSFRLDDVAFCTRVTGAEVSPSGKYAVVNYSTTDSNTKRSRRYAKLREMKNGGSVLIDQLPDGNWNWLDAEDLLWSVQTRPDGVREMISLDPVTLARNVMASDLPAGQFSPVPGGRYLIYYTYEEGPKDDERIYRVLEPDDRQPGWRNRSGLALYDTQSGLYRPLTFGSHNTWIYDIAPAGDKLLFAVSRSRLEKRPTTVSSLYQLDLNTFAVDTLVVADGFMSGGKYSPDATQILLSGTPEAFDGIGNVCPAGHYPSMTQGELFIMDIASRKISPVTKDFNPSVTRADWCTGNGKIYFVAEDKDRIRLFTMDPVTGKTSALPVPEDAIGSFSVARNGSVLAVTGQSASNTDRLYAVDLGKKTASRLLDAPGDAALEDIAFGEVRNFDFVNSIGDTINGRYILPANFDPDKKYPMIVNYYGGCSPTSRIFHSRYPHHLYAAMGYVVYVVNPSGATGFGQEFSSRHVNTAGEDPARDIIEGTKEFIRQHPFIDEKKIGCIGASYGGFMTMYLQTVSDLFAAAISHAGISDHTSYWGEGYWGYSYSETSMAGSYPWTHTDLYVKQSPLYNAHKVNTPILFLHGNIDPNVPPAESHQMFTALKLLGKETALVEVADQEHHILDPDKREMWQNTIFAWFAKYLQDDDSWWEALYPSTSL